MSAPRSSQGLAVSAYSARRKEAGSTRVNVVLSPDDLAACGKLMLVWGTTREEAIRAAIRLARRSIAEKEPPHAS